MDIVSHGLWGGIAFGRRKARDFWTSFLFGIAPDLLSFGFFTAGTFLGIHDSLSFDQGPPDPSLIPAYVHVLYGITHSLVVFAAAFGAVWLVRRKPFWPMAAWGLHVIFDIPTHSFAFFPTPFLWPFSQYHINGIPWSHPWVFFPNAIIIVALLLWLYVVKPALQRRKSFDR